MACVFFGFSSILYFPDSEIVLDKGEAIKLEAGHSLTQKFLSKRNNLAKLEFLLSAEGIKEGNTVKMKIADENCSNVIREGELKKAFLDSKNLYDFEFSKISDSKDKIYCTIISFKTKKEKTKKLQIFTQKETTSPFSAKNIDTDEEFSGQSLSLRTAYKNDNLFQNLNELNQRISQYKPWFLKHYYLNGIIFLFLLLSTVIVILLVAI